MKKNDQLDVRRLKAQAGGRGAVRGVHRQAGDTLPDQDFILPIQALTMHDPATDNAKPG